MDKKKENIGILLGLSDTDTLLSHCRSQQLERTHKMSEAQWELLRQPLIHDAPSRIYKYVRLMLGISALFVLTGLASPFLANRHTNAIHVNFSQAPHGQTGAFKSTEEIETVVARSQSGEALKPGSVPALAIPHPPTGSNPMQRSFQLTLPSHGCAIITSSVMKEVEDVLPRTFQGYLHLYSHTPEASITLNENADGLVRSDMLAAMEHMIPKSLSSLTNTLELAEMRALVFGNTLLLPMKQGRLSLGTWQGIYFCRWAQTLGATVTFTATLLSEKEPAKMRTEVFSLNTRGPHPVLAGDGLNKLPAKSKNDVANCKHGLMHTLIRHTSASAMVSTLGEKSSEELEFVFNTLVPNRWNREFFQHTYEGDDDMPGHIKSSTIGVSPSLPLVNGRPALGHKQALFLNEHRDVGGFGVGHQRDVCLHVVCVPAGYQAEISFTPSAVSKQQTDLVLSAVPLDEVMTALGGNLANLPAGVVNLFVRNEHSSILLVPREILFQVSLSLEVAWLYALPHNKKGHASAHLSAMQILSGGPSLTLAVHDGKILTSKEHVLCTLTPKGLRAVDLVATLQPC